MRSRSAGVSRPPPAGPAGIAAAAACAVAMAAGPGACDGDPAAAGAPEAAAATRSLVPGRARLVGAGRSSCSLGPPAAGGARAPDRWCAFSVEPSDSARSELWVVNLTQALAAPPGAPVRCDGSSAHCRRIHADLWTGEPVQGKFHPQAHAFTGDTLVFHAEARSPPTELYRGPVWAWRPGWAAPRRLTSDDGVLCAGHDRAPVAHCIDAIGNDPPRGAAFSIRAGALDENATGPLPHVARIFPLSRGAAAWRAAFTHDGAHFALAHTDRDGGPQILSVVRTADLGAVPLAPIVEDARAFLIARDGRKVYFLSAFRQSLLTAAGTLTAADFPSGRNAAPLVPGVADFDLLGDRDDPRDRGLALILDLNGNVATFAMLRDRDRPDSVVRVQEEIEVAVPSPNLAYTYFMKADGRGDLSGFVARNDGRGVCALNEQPGFPAYGVSFFDKIPYVVWVEDDSDTDVRLAFYGNPDGCSGRRPFARRLRSYELVEDRLLVFGEDEPGGGPGRESMTLKYGLPGGARPPENPVVVARDAGRQIAPVSTTRGAYLVFEVREPRADLSPGLYVHGPLP